MGILLKALGVVKPLLGKLVPKLWGKIKWDESTKTSLVKGGKALFHDMLTAAGTAAITAALTWLLTPGNFESAAGNSVIALAVWATLKPTLVALLDQRRHRQ